MKELIYKLNSNVKKEEIEVLSDVESVSIDEKKNELRIKTDLTPEKLEKLVPTLSRADRYSQYIIKADIDCAECANNVACALKKNSDFSSAEFNFPKGELKVTTHLKENEVKKLAKEVEDNIIFPDKTEKYHFNIKIDCANCAKKIETKLNENPQIEKAILNFAKGELLVETTLSEDEIKRLARKIDEDIVFHDNVNNYKFHIFIDCADCARKVEEGLNKNEHVVQASINYPKGILEVSTTLSQEKIKDLCLLIEEDMKFYDKEEKKPFDINIYRIGASLLLFILSEILHQPILAIAAYIICGYDILFKAVRNIFKGKIFDENFLMAIATIGALVIASYEEAAGVMIFYQVGEYFQKKAVGKSRRDIEALMDLTSDSCTIEEEGKTKEVRSEDVRVGSTIVVKAGEKVSLDGIVLDGTSFLDTKALTGESVPLKVEKGASVLSGSINGNGTLRIKTTKEYSDSTASKILRLVEESEDKKAKSEKFITRFSRYYTPLVTLSALLLALLPPLFGIMDFRESVYRACILLVISCPCALVLSVPLTYFASIGSFAKRGILVKGDESVQKLAKMNALALDKTGTITEGVFNVQKIVTFDSSEMDVMKIAASLESHSTHPIASAIKRYYNGELLNIEDIEEIPGIGIKGKLNGKIVLAGSAKSIENPPKTELDGTLIYISIDSHLIGIISIDDKIKATSKSAIEKLREIGVRKIALLSGDRQEKADKISSELSLDLSYGNLLPQNKLEKLEAMMNENTTLGFAGDGINDAPSLKRVDVGIAMGGVGSDAAIEAADIVIMNDDITGIANAISIAKKTERIVKQNISFSLLIKLIVFILAIFGLTNMWLGVFADTGVAFIAVINAMRALKWKENRK